MEVVFCMLLILRFIFISYFNISKIGIGLIHVGVCSVVDSKHKQN